MTSIWMGAVEYRVFDHLYAVSSCGKVLRGTSPYKPPKRRDGYLTLGRQRLMHRVVAACWLDTWDPAKHVHHINENKEDNRVENLECVTPKEHFGERHDGKGGRYVRTQETRDKLKTFRTGFKDTEETRAVKRAILAEVHPRTPCVFRGVVYPSVSAGARAAGIPAPTFRQRCNSKNFPEYGWP